MFAFRVVEWLDEYHPGSFRQAQVSFSTRIPSAFPLGDAATMSTNVCLYRYWKLLSSYCNRLSAKHIISPEIHYKRNAFFILIDVFFSFALSDQFSGIKHQCWSNCLKKISAIVLFSSSNISYIFFSLLFEFGYFGSYAYFLLLSFSYQRNHLCFFYLHLNSHIFPFYMICVLSIKAFIELLNYWFCVY